MTLLSHIPHISHIYRSHFSYMYSSHYPNVSATLFIPTDRHTFPRLSFTPHKYTLTLVIIPYQTLNPHVPIQPKRITHSSTAILQTIGLKHSFIAPIYNYFHGYLTPCLHIPVLHQHISLAGLPYILHIIPTYISNAVIKASK